MPMELCKILENKSSGRKYIVSETNFDRNSINGICWNDTRKYFFKISNKESIISEFKGYKLYSLFSYCGEIVDIFSIDSEKSVLIYKYRSNLKENRMGELCDLLNDENCDANKIGNILTNYICSFSYVGEIYDNIQYNKFFLKRTSYLRKASNFHLINNNYIEYLNLLIKEFNLGKLGILTHGDPSDLNFCSDGTFIDFEEVSYNNPILEMIMLFWNLYLGGAYFFPKYESSKYVMHTSVYNNRLILKPEVDGFNLYVTKQRISIIVKILEIFDKITNIYCEEKSINAIPDILSFRALTVIPIGQLSKEEEKVITFLLTQCKNFNFQKESPFDFLKRIVISTLRVRN